MVLLGIWAVVDLIIVLTGACNGDQDVATGAVYLLQEGTVLQVNGGIPLITLNGPESDTTMLHQGPGRYYLHVTAATMEDWTVTLEQAE